MSTSSENLKYWVAFNHINSIGPLRWQQLMSHFPTPEIAWLASKKELMRAGFTSTVADLIVNERREVEPDQAWEEVTKHRLKIVTLGDNAYPDLLKKMYAPPPLLYYQGSIEALTKMNVAMVGSRNLTEYGKRVTTMLATRLSQAGLAIVSGLALGVDGVAHRACLDAGGSTIAVLGNGLEKIYPVSHHKLAEKITGNNGVIISEFPIGTQPFKSNFPQRNRIIAGLSKAVLVTEAREKSGSLITAKFALENNRDVLAVPGTIESAMSKGTNLLIKNGATPILSAEDALEALGISSKQQKKKLVLPDNETQKNILKILRDEPAHVDKIVRISRLSINAVNAELSEMEIKGMVVNCGNQIYQIS